ncbi:MAG: ATP-dependent RecD-like DNA helicase [Lachnospiraceae bacterium]|nr:ATP-dependent RecD-like DNA helicase [Lachnospiraceae bacterium]
MEQIEGFVEHITFRNEENGYTVMQLNVGGKQTSVVGLFPGVSEGESLRVTGTFTTHPVYGEQLNAEQFEVIAPEGEAAILRYLSSGAVRGIKEALARRIVDAFGADTFRILEEEPERLAEVRGISPRGAMKIAADVAEKREMRTAMLFLQQYGISLSLAAKIYRKYGGALYTIVRENPYKLAEDIRGVGFRSADEIARQAGIRPDSEFRIRSAVLYLLSQASGVGHSCLPREELLTGTEQLLSIELADFDHILSELIADKKIVVRRDGADQFVYATAFFRMEAGTARMLSDMNLRDNTLKEAEVEKKVLRLTKDLPFRPDEEQLRAVKEAVMNGVTLITGGPGTGKTTIIRLIIRYFIREGLDLMLAAPTGRAAKRMTETTGYEAMTLHRMLEVNGDPTQEGGARFQRNEDQPLETDVVIVDEVSMVDITLMYALLKAMTPGMRLVLVGDVDQLPSVGPGEVLKDLIASDCFPVVRLSRIFRQNAESDIIVNAHKINAGEIVEKKKSPDFLFIEREQAGNITGAMITLLREKLPAYVHCSVHDVQVLTPMRKGILGIENLNPLLQEQLNPPSPDKNEKQFSFALLREGDKVMQIKNNYQLEWEIEGSFPKERGMGVFNGDTGIVRRISHFDENVTVEFEDRKIVTYPFDGTDELELAYAVTIHKAQGSEYPAVILPLLTGPRLLMTRNLLYTAVTRARACVAIVGRYETFLSMIANDQKEKRYSGLKNMIREIYGDL